MKIPKRLAQVALSMLGIGVLLLAACAPAAPAPTPKPPAPTVAPAAPAPTVAPAAPTPILTPRPAVTAPTPVAPAKPAEEKPRYGGTLKIGIDTELPGYDPHVYAASTRSASNALFNGLFVNDPKGHLEPKPMPDLVERWEMSSDGTVYTFYLHKGVKFHDGTPLTAQDVVFSLNKVRNPPKGILRAPQLEAGLLVVDKMEAVDDYTVKITLKHPSATFIANLAENQLGMVPKDYMEKGGYWEGNNVFNKKPIGSGPFMLKEHIRGVSFEAVKNPNYFKKGLPYLDGFIAYIIQDAGARLAALRTERIHFMPVFLFARPSEEKILKREMGDRIVTWQTPVDYTYEVFTLNWKRKPFDDLRVRKAIRLALNNEEYFQVLYEGLGQPSGPVGRSYWALPKEELQKYPGFEPDYQARLAEAKKLLAEAGFPGGFEVETIGAAARWYNVANMQYASAALKRIGINLKLRPQELGAFNDNVVKANFDTVGTSHGASSGDPDGVLGTFYITKGARNYAQYSNPKIDELYAKQSRELDPAKRREIVWEMQRILLADVAWPMYGINGRIANRLASVRGGEVAAPFDNYFNSRYEAIWLAE